MSAQSNRCPYLTKGFYGAFLWAILLVGCAQEAVEPSPAVELKKATPVNPPKESVSSDVVIEIVGLANVTEMLSDPACPVESWTSQWVKAANTKSPNVKRVYFGESSVARDRGNFATSFGLVAQLVDRAKFDAAVMSKSHLSFGTSSWVQNLKRQSGRGSPWIFDYTISGVPWATQRQLSWKNPDKTNGALTVVTRNDDFNPLIPLYLDFPYRRSAKSFERSNVRTTGDVLTVVRPSSQTLSNLESPKAHQWGVIVSRGLSSRDRSRISSLSSQGWFVLDENARMFRLALLKDGSIRSTPIPCTAGAGVPIDDSGKELAALVKQAGKVERDLVWGKKLGSLAYDLDVAGPDADSGRPTKGYWLADVIRVVAHSDLTVLPSYAVSSEPFKAGELTFERFARGFPTDERIYLIDMLGKDIKKALARHGESPLAQSEGDYPFFYSGKDIEIRMNPGQATVVAIKNLQDDRYYKVATLESIINQSSKYLGNDFSGTATPVKFRVHQGLEIFVTSKMSAFKKPLGVSTVSLIRK